MRAILAGAAMMGLFSPSAWSQSSPAPVTTLPEVSVTGTREKELLVETPASVGVIKGETLRQDRPAHPAQIMGQVPGVAVAVTNGEGHTTAIRHPFTTNPVYLFLEDGIPIRSTGFFNHNALYEINIPQSGGIEVIRGPGTALYGSDAIGGVINVLTRTPPSKPEFTLSGELGGYGFGRILAGGGNAYGNDSWRADLNLTHTDGWRGATAYNRQSGTFRWDRSLRSDAMLKTVLAFSNISQQTGANSPLVLSDYITNPTRNYLPIAYRKVGAFRLSTSYERESGDTLISITPYVRDHSMELLASFTLNSDPTVSTTENKSFGVMAKWRRDFPQMMRARLIVGADVDVSPGGRQEDSLNVNVTGTAPSRVFNSYSIARRVYDYDVTFQGISPYVHGELSPMGRLRMTGGLRIDHLSYRFDNHLAGAPVFVPAGVTFPGARFYGQANSIDVTFRHISPKLGATYALGRNTHVFAGYTHGFRAPSEGNLFRPSVGASAAAAQASMQSALALKPIKADQFEIGLRGLTGSVSYDAVVYDLTKRDDIVSQRDPVTTLSQAVNAGKTRHRGVEVGAGTPCAGNFRLDVALSYARHTYEDWVTTQGIFSGKNMEAAPRVMSNTRLTWQPAAGARVQLEWVRLGSYWLDAANTRTYSGHDLLNLRANWPIARDVSFFGSIYNLQDRRYADSAQLSNNQPVLSPGLPRTLYAGAEAKW
ncbi:MAG: TonB-dependent receptor [Burkholderiales bacterium]|nr:TonB-dependent receptor [Burkholderiales bacterium]